MIRDHKIVRSDNAHSIKDENGLKCVRIILIKNTTTIINLPVTVVLLSDVTVEATHPTTGSHLSIDSKI